METACMHLLPVAEGWPIKRARILDSWQALRLWWDMLSRSNLVKIILTARCASTVSLALNNLSTYSRIVHLIGYQLLLWEHIWIWSVCHRDILNVLLLNSTALSREELLLVHISRIDLSSLFRRWALRLGELLVCVAIGFHGRASAILRKPQISRCDFALF